MLRWIGDTDVGAGSRNPISNLFQVLFQLVWMDCKVRIDFGSECTDNAIRLFRNIVRREAHVFFAFKAKKFIISVRKYTWS